MQKLFTNIQLGNVPIKNRIVMPAMGSGFGNDDGGPSEQTRNYYLRRAIGGAGLIIVELTSIDPLGNAGPKSLRIYEDKIIDRYIQLTEELKQGGAHIAIQLNHTGRQANSHIIHTQPVCPSPSPVSANSEVPRELTNNEIKSLVEAFINGARRAKKAGFDAIELHGAHGYLIWQFLSPLCNKRKDEYGGNTNGRTRFALEIVRGIKQELGKDFPVIFRISGSDFLDGGLTLNETKIIARLLEEAGIDTLHVSGGNWGAMQWMIQPMTLPRGCLVHLAEVIRKEVTIPVITVGRINDPMLAESILQEEKADMVAMGRGLLADPDLPMKASEGNFEDIRKCVACNICIHQRLKGSPLACMINPEVGREKDFMKKPDRCREILVIGGGPAGLEAARVAKLRGHDVTLCEKDDRLGGQVNLATKAPYKEEMKSIVPYYTTQLKKLGATVELGKEVTLALVETIEPDAVVLATGSIPSLPDIPGIEQDNVFSARDVLEEKVKISGKVVIIGGGHVGCETAEFLWSKGISSTILEMLEDVLMDMEPIGKPLLIKRLDEHVILTVVGSKVINIKKNQITYSNRNGHESSIEADYFIFATGTASENDLMRPLEQKGFDVYVVGDCVKPRDILSATSEGAEVGRKL